MNTKFTPLLFVWSIFTCLLVACNMVSTQAGSISAPTTLTPPPIPTLTPTPTLAILNTALESGPSPTSTPAPPSMSSPPNGLHMAYIIHGNLYFQDGSNRPLQLTSSGEDHDPVFSDDGEKIAFLRGTYPSNVYSINIDGSQEQAIVTTSQLQNLGADYDTSTATFGITFVPGTHRLLFSTNQFQEGSSPLHNGDLLIVDTETAEIEKLPNYVSSLYVSPDGRYIAIDKVGSIELIDLNGNVVHKKLLTYTPSQPSFVPPGIFWTQDSTELIILVPTQPFIEVGYIPSYALWRYSLESHLVEEIRLDPLPMEVYQAEVSPDANWIIYDREDQNAFYLGDLRTGTTQLYEPDPYVFHYDWSWSSDNEHFVYSASPGSTLYLGSVDGEPAFIGKGEFLGWIDAYRYLYYAGKNIVMGNINGSKEIILADHESFKNLGTIFTFILPKAR